MNKVSFLLFLLVVSFSSKEALAGTSSSNFTVIFTVTNSCTTITKNNISKKSSSTEKHVEIKCAYQTPFEISSTVVHDKKDIIKATQSNSLDNEQKVITITY